MKIQFTIEYKTHFGQQLQVMGSLPELGSNNPGNAVMMQLSDPEQGIWSYSFDLEIPIDFQYRYIVKDDNFHTVIREWGADRSFSAPPTANHKIQIHDHWRSLSDPFFVLCSSAFVKAVFKPRNFKVPKPKSLNANQLTVRFQLLMPAITEDELLLISGNSNTLGRWDPQKALPMANPDYPAWIAEVRVPKNDLPLEYKYLIRNESTGALRWEDGMNRVLQGDNTENPDILHQNDDSFRFPGVPWKGSGVAIPVFSLRTENGFGIGEFSDLMLLTDWAVETGMRMIQILPVNDTIAKHNWQDSYPYAAISVFALHPVYINLRKIGVLEADISQQIIEAQGAYLNSLNKIDYEAVMVLKARFFKLIYDQNKARFLQDPAYLQFFRDNEFWLRPYAAFSYLRDLFNTSDFSRWGEYSYPAPGLMEQLTAEDSPHFDDIAVHYFQQYHAHLQLKEAADYARSRGIVLKGDIPIGIYRNSVDAWTNPGLYHLDRQAGAPPDDFSAIGQNWRFPTYNWEAMAKDGYAWWRQRLQQLSQYFDAFRIDHILGFFRIWEIPDDQVEGLMGYFNPSLPYSKEELENRGLWVDEARLCEPYIREHFLWEIFGDLTTYVKNHFLEEYAQGCFHLKPEYNTQRKVELAFAAGPETGPEERNRLECLTKGLFSLISERILLRNPDGIGQTFFPRNALHFTHSYRDLDDHSKHVVSEIYLDYFYRRNETLWREKAMEKLPFIKEATEMLLCGEDLGMVPACVPEVMQALCILSLEVQRMPKDPKINFGNPARYPWLSVATPSSHDTSTIRGWWEEDFYKTQRFYNEILGKEGQAPANCTPEIAENILNRHLESPSMWTVFPLQDLLATDETLRLPDPHAERINQPGNPNHYWRYRMHLSLEDLLRETKFNQRISQMIRGTGR